MYEDKTLVCKECGEEFVLPQESRSSTQSADSRMNPSVVNHAATHERQPPEVRESISQLFAHPAETKLVYPSSPRQIDQSIAAIASQRLEKTTDF